MVSTAPITFVVRMLTILDHCRRIFGDRWRIRGQVSLGPWLLTSSTNSYGSSFEPSKKSLIVIFCWVALALFFLFLLVVASYSVSMLAGGPDTSSLTRVFFKRVFLTSITSRTLAFSFPLDCSWMTLTALSPTSSGNGGIAAVWGGRLRIWCCLACCG